MMLAWVFLGNAQTGGKYQIKFLEINKSNSDYAVAIVDENKLIFTSADQDASMEKRSYNPRKDLFVGDIDFDGEIKNVHPVAKKFDENFNQTGMAFTNDKGTVYFSRNKYEKKKKKQDQPENQRLTLYKADVAEDGSWNNIVKLPFSGKDDFSDGHPVLSPDNKKLYFVSDRLPSKGKTDIFVVDIREDGSFGRPRNMGNIVNTPGTETTPYITKDNILYFSSDGHPGKGKLDVFAVELFESSTSEIKQLESPINSINDDFAYIVNEENNQGFFTSNRLQGKGYNDLYSFTLEEEKKPEECLITVDGRVRDKESAAVLSGATVKLYDLGGSLLESVSTYEDGTYAFKVSCAKEYKLVASRPEYESDEKRIEILEENYHSALHTNLNLSRIAEEQPKPVASPVAFEALQPIYYAFDDASITNRAAEKMDRIAEVMKANPDLIIEAASFTDARGTDAYNLELSKRRARSAVEYLKSKGIDESRIRSKGLGEAKMINQCVNGVTCQEEAHQMNRRTEFSFVNTPSKPKNKEGQKSIVAERTRQTVREVPREPVVVKKPEADPEPIKLAQQAKEPVAMPRPEPEPEPQPQPEKEYQKPVIVQKEEVKTQKQESQIAEIANKKIEIKARETFNKEKDEIEEVPVLADASPKEITSKAPLSNEPAEEERIAEPVAPEVSRTPVKEETAVAVTKETETRQMALAEEPIAEEKEELAEAAPTVKDNSEAEAEPAKEAVIINYNSSIVATNPESNKVLNYIGTEKVKMIDQLNELEKKYEEAIPEYPRVSDSLRTEMAKIGDVIQKAEELDETGWADIIEYKNNVLHFKRRYRELMVMNSRAQNGRMDVRRSSPSVSSASKVSNEEEIAQQEQQEEEKEKLSIDNVKITAMKKNGNGKYQVTNSANKTDLIKVTFKLRSNEKVNSGQKEAHLVLQDPDGQVAEAKGIFKMKDTEQETKYTDHAIINYNSHDVDVTMFIQRRGSNFEKGVYPVKLFLEGQLMAVTNLNLQNSY